MKKKKQKVNKRSKAIMDAREMIAKVNAVYSRFLKKVLTAEVAEKLIKRWNAGDLPDGKGEYFEARYVYSVIKEYYPPEELARHERMLRSMIYGK